MTSLRIQRISTKLNTSAAMLDGKSELDKDICTAVIIFKLAVY
jgi:hypothetical protein